MSDPARGVAYEGSPAEIYQRHFVPVIGRPAAMALVKAADPSPGERVLDVACGTGVATRLAAEKVGPTGRVTGLDVNPGMLSVARSVTPRDAGIDWVQAPGEDMPLPDRSFDLVLCGMGLQFFEDRAAGVAEMHRVLVPGGRAALSLPGPIPEVFRVLEAGLARHLGPEAAGCASAVFSLHEPDEIRALTDAAGFESTRIERGVKKLRVPPPAEFLWQYVHGTPLASAAAQADEDNLESLERDVCAGWQEHVEDGDLVIEVGMTTVLATA